MILAVGFGQERRVNEVEPSPYWRDDALDQALTSNYKVLISGTGDGGLIDTLRVKLRDFRHDTMVKDFLDDAGLEPVKEDLGKIEEAARAQESREKGSGGRSLSEGYSRLAKTHDAVLKRTVDLEIRNRSRDDVSVVLNGKDGTAYSLGASILSRFLISRLILTGRLSYKRGELEYKKTPEGYPIHFNNVQDPDVFNLVICRHGPEGALKTFKDVWKHAGELRALAALDQTRLPIYARDTFGPLPGGSPLALQAAARGKLGLDRELERLCGHTLEGVYRLDSLAKIGSQFAVFRGTNLHDETPVAIKLAWVDYPNPARFGRQEVELVRAAVQCEWDSLCLHRKRVRTLPWPIERVVAPNPLLAGRDPTVSTEVYLVEQWIEGASFDDVRQELHPSAPSGEDIAQKVWPLMTSLLSTLAKLEPAPALFADVSPHNFIWRKETKETWLVDAGSLVKPGTLRWDAEAPGARTRSRITTAVTLPYLSAEDVAAYERGEPRTVEPVGVIRALGKMFHELATNLHPVKGKDPSLTDERYLKLPPPLRGALDPLLSGSLKSMADAASTIQAARMPR